MAMKALGHVPLEGQKRLFHVFSRFAVSQKAHCALLIKGYAGTGKTSCVGAMVNTLLALGKKVVLLAPTGRAAKVLSQYSGLPASTIHRHIYRQRNSKHGGFWFELKENEDDDVFYFVDEASMIGGRSETDYERGATDLLEDLITYVFGTENNKLVLIGDNAQLTPIGSKESPALDLSLLKSTYHLNIAGVVLDEVVRQGAGSGILINATTIRNSMGKEKEEWPKLHYKAYADCHWLQEDLQGAMENAYRDHGIEETLFITKSNKRANLYNQQIRTRILWNEEEINQRDRLLVVKNNYYWLQKVQIPNAFIANGDMLVVERIHRFEDRDKFRFCHATVSMPDHQGIPPFDALLLCNPIHDESSSMSTLQMDTLKALVAEDYLDIESPERRRKAIAEDPYWNAIQIKFAYALTCHKAQGGQWSCIFIDHGFIGEETEPSDLNRWLYTAITRATKEVYFVGFDAQLNGDE